MAGNTIDADHADEERSPTSTSSIILLPKKNAKSKVWVHFGFFGNAEGEITDNKHVVCRLCAPLGKKPIPYSGGTTNMYSHLERHHPVQYSELECKSDATKSGGKQDTLPNAIARSHAAITSS